MAIEALQSKLNKALTTNAAGDYALRTQTEGAQTMSSLTMTGDISAGGNYLLNDQTTTNMMSKGTVYDFNTDGQEIIIPANAAFVDTFSGGGYAMVDVFIRSDGEDNTGYLLASNATATNGWAVNVQNESGGLVDILFFRYFTVANGGWRLTTDIPINKWTNICIVYDDSSSANDPVVYINGVSVGIDEVNIPSGDAKSDAGRNFSIGNRGDTLKTFDGQIANVMLGNFAPTASEVKDLISGNIPFKWQYGSQTDLVTNGQDWTGATGATRPNGWTSVYGVGVNTIVNDGGDHTTALKLEVGATENPDISQTFTAVIGKEYTVSIDVKYVDGTRVDIGVGSVALTKDYLNTSTTTAAWTTFTTTFIATTAAIWIDIRQVGASASGFYSYVDNVTCFALGAVALYDQTSISETTWYDKANGNDGAVTGASVLNPHGHAVDSAGAVPGILFPATQVVSTDVNMLDDYQEGTWTPVVTLATPGDLSVAYSYQIGDYQKIGNWVNVNCSLRTTTFTHTTASGALQITGLPFTSATLTNNDYHGSLTWRGITKANYTDISAYVASNSTSVLFNISGSGQVMTDVDTADVPTGGTVILKFTLRYKASA